MENLSNYAIEVINDLHTERLEYFSEYQPIINALNKLKDYEELDEQGLLIRLPKELADVIDKQNLYLALLRSINLVKFGVDTNELNTAVETHAALRQAYMRGRKDEIDKYSMVYKNRGDDF